MVVIRVLAFVAAASAAAEMVVPAVALVAISFAAATNMARPAAQASPPRRRHCRLCRRATLPHLLLRRHLRLRRRRPEAAVGLPVGMAAVAATVVAVATSGQARLRRLCWSTGA